MDLIVTTHHDHRPLLRAARLTVDRVRLLLVVRLPVVAVFTTMPPASKKGVKRRVQLFTKVSRLKGLLLARGENREVDEREIASLDRLRRFRSVADLQALFARKPRSVLWLSNYVYLYKRSRLESSLDLLDFNVKYEGVTFQIHTCTDEGEEVLTFELHWKKEKRSNRTVIVSIDRIFGVLARDTRIASIVTTHDFEQPFLSTCESRSTRSLL